MRQQTDNTGRYATLIALLAFLLAVIFSFVGVGVWWIESRFGAGVAVAVLGGVLAIGAFTGGALFAHRQNRRSLAAAGELVYAASDAFRASAGAQREIAKGVSAWQVAGAKAQLIDHKSDRRWDDQRVRALVDAQLAAERAKLDREYADRVARLESSTAPAWAGADDGADDSGAGFRFLD